MHKLGFDQFTDEEEMELQYGLKNSHNHADNILEAFKEESIIPGSTTSAFSYFRRPAFRRLYKKTSYRLNIAFNCIPKFCTYIRIIKIRKQLSNSRNYFRCGTYDWFFRHCYWYGVSIL